MFGSGSGLYMGMQIDAVDVRVRVRRVSHGSSGLGSEVGHGSCLTLILTLTPVSYTPPTYTVPA